MKGITSSYSNHSKSHDLAPAQRGGRFRLAENHIISPRLVMLFLEAVFGIRDGVMDDVSSKGLGII